MSILSVHSHDVIHSCICLLHFAFITFISLSSLFSLFLLSLLCFVLPPLRFSLCIFPCLIDPHPYSCIFHTQLFSDVSNHQWFANAAIILFLNKSDVFREKIKQVPISLAFPDYNVRIFILISNICVFVSRCCVCSCVCTWGIKIRRHACCVVALMCSFCIVVVLF